MDDRLAAAFHDFWNTLIPELEKIKGKRLTERQRCVIAFGAGWGLRMIDYLGTETLRKKKEE
jgi:hypothetical protein